MSEQYESGGVRRMWAIRRKNGDYLTEGGAWIDDVAYAKAVDDRERAEGLALAERALAGGESLEVVSVSRLIVPGHDEPYVYTAVRRTLKGGTRLYLRGTSGTNVEWTSIPDEASYHGHEMAQVFAAEHGAEVVAVAQAIDLGLIATKKETVSSK